MYYRNCIGQHFAILEIKVAVAHILNRFVHSLAGNFETHYSKTIIFCKLKQYRNPVIKLSFNTRVEIMQFGIQYLEPSVLL